MRFETDAATLSWPKRLMERVFRCPKDHLAVQRRGLSLSLGIGFYGSGTSIHFAWVA